MEYHEAANFLFDLRRFQVNPGTESIRSLLEELGDPHADTTFVQIAGSNGKGSTARMVESVLRETGLTVGLYTSPHFDDIRERIRVDGRKIPKASVARFVAETKPTLVERAANGEPLTFFETVTAMALWHFGATDVDVAVLEVGMGGELDATSVVDPVASAVTNVTLEHTSVLGDTIAEIASTKAAVEPVDGPLVTAADGEALSTLRAKAESLVVVGGEGEDVDVVTTYGGRETHLESTISLAGGGWTLSAQLPLLGAHQTDNAGIAVILCRQVARRLDVDLDDGTLVRGLRGAHWPGRFEVLSQAPLVVLDAAHNPGACEQVAATLEEFDYERLHLVFGAMHDKDHRAMLEALPTPDTAVSCRPNLSRAEDPEILARVLDAVGTAVVETRPSVAEALAAARERASAGDCVLVTGSLFCVGEARTTWTRSLLPKQVREPAEAAAVLSDADVPSERRRASRLDEATLHRVVRTRLERRQASYLREALLSVGGECVVSGHEYDGELASVVLTGTLRQFRRLVDDLEDAPHGLPAVADSVRRRVGLDELDRQVAAGGRTNRHDYPWEDDAAVMGVLNVTPDSFHDGGEYYDLEDAVSQAERMVAAGADIVDVGGESTRPGADPVPVDEEIRRIRPVVEALSGLDTLLSVDTRKAAVAEAALDAGADIINDVTGLDDPEMRFLVAEREVPVIVMHSIDTPVDPATEVEYDDVVEDVVDQLTEKVLLARRAGIPRDRIIVDPGLGFGKSAAESFELLDRLDELHAFDCPVLVGHSHKSMFGLVGREEGERSAATVAATALATDRGADIVRVHDVAENVAAVRVAAATRDPASFEEE